LGLYTSTVVEQYTPYVFPSECGGREDVRWLTLTDPDGKGLMVIGLTPLHVDALYYSLQNRAEARHAYDLVSRDEVILHLDGLSLPGIPDLPRNVPFWLPPTRRDIRGFSHRPGAYNAR